MWLDCESRLHVTASSHSLYLPVRRLSTVVTPIHYIHQPPSIHCCNSHFIWPHPLSIRYSHTHLTHKSFIHPLLSYLPTVVISAPCCYIYPMLSYLPAVVISTRCCHICPLLSYLPPVVISTPCCQNYPLLSYLPTVVISTSVVISTHCCHIYPLLLHSLTTT